MPRNGSLVAVGPFFVLGAARQTGTMLVRNQVRHLHLDYHEHGDLKLRKLPDEPGSDAASVVAAFTYGNIPMVEKPQGVTGPGSLSWLDLEAETMRSQVRTRVTHTLTLRASPPPSTATVGEKGANDVLRWDITTVIAPATKWSDIEQLKVMVPPEWSPAEEGIPPMGQEKDHFLLFRSSALLREGPSQPVRMEGRYETLCKTEGRAVLKLPRPQGVVEPCEVRIDVPKGSELVLHNAEPADLELVKQNGTNEQTWRRRHVSADWPGIDVSWRPYRPELDVKSVVDLTLLGRHGEVRQEIHWHSPQGLPDSMSLRVPPAVGDSLRIVEGGSLQVPRDSAAGSRGQVRLVVPAKAGEADCRVVLQYTTALGDKGQPPRTGEPFAVPLVVPEQATRGEVKVRVWSEPGVAAFALGRSAVGRAEHRGSQGPPRLAGPCRAGAALDAPLVLRVGEPSPVFTVLVERALVCVQLLEGGGQQYRARFQLRHLAGPYLDVQLPGPVLTLNVQVTLNRRQVTPDMVNESGQRTDGGSIARLRLGPDLVRQTALLDVSYQLPTGRTGGSPLRATLQPPLLRGAPATVPTRWQVAVPSNRVLLAPESAAGIEHAWARRGWLLATCLNRTGADLEREFEESLPTELRHGDEQLPGEGQTTPTLVCWQDSVETLTVTHAPRQAWLLVCSLGLLILGLGLYWAARPSSADNGRMAAVVVADSCRDGPGGGGRLPDLADGARGRRLWLRAGRPGAAVRDRLPMADAPALSPANRLLAQFQSRSNRLLPAPQKLRGPAAADRRAFDRRCAPARQRSDKVTADDKVTR